MLETILFYILAAVAVIGALVTITRRHPLSAALSLVVSFIALAGLYALLTAQLMAILQILVYAGAIMALVVFVIMLLNVRDEDLDYHERIGRSVGLSLLLAAPIAAVVIVAILRLPGGEMPATVAADFGTIKAVGRFLYSEYMLAFEVVSILLTVALIGVVVLAKRRI